MTSPFWDPAGSLLGLLRPASNGCCWRRVPARRVAGVGVCSAWFLRLRLITSIHLLVRPPQCRDLVLEVREGFESPVHRGEAEVSHLVEIAQRTQDRQAHPMRGNLG